MSRLNMVIAIKLAGQPESLAGLSDLRSKMTTWVCQVLWSRYCIASNSIIFLFCQHLTPVWQLANTWLLQQSSSGSFVGVLGKTAGRPVSVSAGDYSQVPHDTGNIKKHVHYGWQ